MQAKVEIGDAKNLYEYWHDMLYRSVIDESRIIINLASKEYSKCIEKYLTPKDKYITISFCEQPATSNVAIAINKCFVLIFLLISIILLFYKGNSVFSSFPQSFTSALKPELGSFSGSTSGIRPGVFASICR